MADEEMMMDPPAEAPAMDAPAEDAPLMEDKKEEPMMMEPKMEEKAPLGGGLMAFGKDEDSDDDYESVAKKDLLTSCCCCLCVCENTATRNETCCCCCPIKCGVQVIGGLTILLCFYYISWNFFLILNDQVAWWFPVVTIVLLIPLYVASALYVGWFINDNRSNRGNLTGSVILSLVSISLVALWNVIYYTAIYKREDVFIGYGVNEDKYQKFQKKYYLFKVLLEAAILLALYAYFMCVVTSYKNLLRQEKDKAKK